MRADSPPGLACYEAEVGYFLHTPLGGGHTSHHVTSTHGALDKLCAESQTHFEHSEMGRWAKGCWGSFSKPCMSWESILGPLMHPDTLCLRELNCTTAIRELFYLCMLHYDTLCVNKERGTRHNLGSKCYFVICKYWRPLSQQRESMRVCVTLTTICFKQTVGH